MADLWERLKRIIPTQNGRSDHKPLKGLLAHGVSPSARVAKWLATMSQYNYTLEYMPGNKISHADALSRRTYPEEKYDSRLNPIENPTYDMDEDSTAKMQYFPPLDIGTQTCEMIPEQKEIQCPNLQGSVALSNVSNIRSLFQGGDGYTTPLYDKPGSMSSHTQTPGCCAVTRSQTRAEKHADDKFEAEKQAVTKPGSVVNKQPLHEVELRNKMARSMAHADITDTGFFKQLSSAEFDTSNLKREQRLDPDLGPMIKYLEHEKLPSELDKQKSVILGSSSYSMYEGLLYHHSYQRGSMHEPNNVFQLAIPIVFKAVVLHQAHDCLMGGHRGIKATLAKIRPGFHWKSMESDVMAWIKSCPRCNQRGKVKDRLRAPLQPLPAYPPLSHWQVDIAGPLPRTTSNHRYILTCMDIGTKFVIYIPLKEVHAQTVAMALFDYIFCKFGSIKSLQSDQGSQFVAMVTQALCKMLGVDWLFSSAFHPQSQGQVERDHGTISDHLSKYVNLEGAGEDWDTYLASSAFCHNNSVHATTGVEPNLLVFGRVMNMPMDLQIDKPSNLPSKIAAQIDFLINEIDRAQQKADANITAAAEKMKARYDRGTVKHEYTVGSCVWLYVPYMPMEMGRKLKSPWCGPFRILSKEGDLNYKLRAERTLRKLKYPIHVNRLRPYVTSSLRPLDSEELRQTHASEPDLGLEVADLFSHNVEKGGNKLNDKGTPKESIDQKLESHDLTRHPPLAPGTPLSQAYEGRTSEKPPPVRVNVAPPGNGTTRPGPLPYDDGVSRAASEVEKWGTQLNKGSLDSTSRHLIPPQGAVMTDGSQELAKAGVGHKRPWPTPGESQPHGRPQMPGIPSHNPPYKLPSKSNKLVDVTPVRAFDKITHGRTKIDGSKEFGVVYADQDNSDIPTWVPEDELSPLEREYIELNPVRILRPREPRID